MKFLTTIEQICAWENRSRTARGQASLDNVSSEHLQEPEEQFNTRYQADLMTCKLKKKLYQHEFGDIEG